MHIHFLGAADTVTGSKHLVDTGSHRILLDCGLFQGYKNLRERNWSRLAVSARHIDTVVLSHAHLDHSGYLPALVKQGFHGRVFATPATCDLAEVLLLDSAHLQEEDARRANLYGYSKHTPAEPLYTVEDARRALNRLHPLPFGEEIELHPEVTVKYTPAGHLLGAAAVTLRCQGRTIVYSGDLGRHNDLLMPPPEPVHEADVLLVESTYGNRLHPADDVLKLLGDLIRTCLQRGGSVLMPTFAVGRAQALMLALHRLKRAGEIPAQVPIFLDSPMAAEATQLYERHQALLRVPPEEVAHLCDGVTLVDSPQASEALTRSHYPRIVLSASGMATGGRVLHHLKVMAPHPKNLIVFPGFQVGGSRGAKMIAGATEVKIHGEYVPVKAEVRHLEGFSGHADAGELMDWLRHFRKPPRHTYVVHGEPEAADALRTRIKEDLGWRVSVPDHLARIELD
ncbi:MBL fold metallo-hydrolase RNA specificity domain-containing protein [Caldimonas sp.]|uniref:MBL fold metallo-hydrolase RNA specificity domain-containing protein n=1 Tax=Caldimonas sp. TaxID=2838790 RepID=UPI00391BAF33